MAKGSLTDIVQTERSDVYPRIETRNGGALSRVSEGKTLLITGASKGIGRSIAVLHAHTRPRSIILTARSIGPLDAVAAELEVIDSNIIVIKASLDVGDAGAVGLFFKHLKEVKGVGRIDVLFNNAGCLEPVLPFAQQDLSTWTTTLNTNMLGVANVTHGFLRHNFAAVGGSPDGTTAGLNSDALKGVSVIGTSSMGSNSTMPGFSGYMPSKTWMNRFFEFLDTDYGTLSPFGSEGLRAFCFHPGGIPTEGAQNLPQSILDLWRDNGHDSPDLSGGFTAWLLTPEADFLRGRYVSATWDVDELVGKKEEILARDLLKTRVEME
ncbi:NAD(P)-binding protein [Athelia psychrophila]|uniref:NAD(P)-binding protein n=1 Tax=Athelia psychrophila TaxID=1759441 RepID=A0A166M3C0_9AGAM|nr:NAD(P)-binding protein [Fibularhizoctonia sp. CBS 109695]